MSVRRVARVLVLALIAGFGSVANMAPGFALAAEETLSASDKAIYKAAFAAVDDGNLAKARTLAAGAHNRTLADVILWQSLLDRSTKADFADITGFITTHATWPQLDTLHIRAEEAITGTEGTAAILAWFSQNPPFTGHGKVMRAFALADSGQIDDANAQARNLWANDILGSDDEERFIARFSALFTPDLNNRRADNLLWDNGLVDIKRVLPMLDAPHQALANARLALQTDAVNAATLVTLVPPSLQDDGGLLFDRVHHERVHDHPEAAAGLLGLPGANKGRPQRWWKERAVIIRALLAKGQSARAYQLATNNGLRTGWPAGEAEFLAGWIALRFLKSPELAIPHFQAMLTSVSYPTSVARAQYWAGRAAEAAGYGDISQSWYAKAATQTSTFYGQLAASKLGGGQPMTLPPDPVPTDADRQRLESAPMTKVVRQLTDVGRPDLAKPFLVHIVDDAPTPGLYALAAALSRELGRVDAGVIIARKAVHDGVSLGNAAFPVLKVDYPEAPEKALVLSIIRQESNFQTDAGSGVGALGLMQLMPTTAKEIAKAQSLPPATPGRLLTDPTYNIRLGSAYLAHLVNQFHGSYVLAVASYNAGPGRSAQWINGIGDPRQGQFDVVDWIELIPIQETRNYVQRVMEAVVVYRMMLGQATTVNLAKDLTR